MKTCLLCFAIVLSSLSVFSQKGYDDDVEFKLYYENGTHYLIKYYPYGEAYDIDNNGKIGRLSLVDVYLIKRYFDMTVKVELVKIGRTFSSYYLKEDTPYLKEQLDFAKKDAKENPNEFGAVLNKPIKPVPKL